MKILVTGAGRGGTNLVTELIRASNLVKFTEEVEDRNFFKHKKLPDNYGTKLATENKGFTIESIDKVLKNNPDLYVVFSLRHPIDNCLSKIVRGQPKSRGGDSNVEEIAPDATIKGSIKAIKHMFIIYDFLNQSYNNRLITVKMEDLFNNLDDIINRLVEKFNINDTNDMRNFYQKNRNKYQKKRYGNRLKEQINLYKDLDKNFNGYFKNNNTIVNEIRNELNLIHSILGYE